MDVHSGPTALSEVVRRAKEISRNWEKISYPELERQIISLEKRARKEPSAMKVVDNLRFRLVFPLERDFSSFAKRVCQTAKQIFRQQSMRPFNGLHPTQKREISRYAGGGA